MNAAEAAVGRLLRQPTVAPCVARDDTASNESCIVVYAISSAVAVVAKSINSIQAEELGLEFGVRGMSESDVVDVVCPGRGRDDRSEAWEERHHEYRRAIRLCGAVISILLFVGHCGLFVLSW